MIDDRRVGSVEDDDFGDTIGVWVGREAMLLSGVTIGDGAVIGARSVVARDVPPYTIVSGNPATIRRTRFPPDQIERLLALKWWEWPTARIDAAMPLLLADDIEAFLVEAERTLTKAA